MIALGGVTGLIGVICLSKNINQQPSENYDDAESFSSLRDPSYPPSYEQAVGFSLSTSTQNQQDENKPPTYEQAVGSTWKIIDLNADTPPHTKKLLDKP